MSYYGYPDPRGSYFESEEHEAQFHAVIAESEFIEQQKAYCEQAEAEVHIESSNHLGDK